jgi:DNA-binding response OmpR family regulator
MKETWLPMNYDNEENRTESDSQQHGIADHKPLKILVVEDDWKIRKSLVRGLNDLGHECDGESDGEIALRHILTEPPDLILLDLLIPGKAGVDVLKAVRAEGIKCPIIVLTALTAVEDRVQGLRLGADDYLMKPFAFDELVARIDAVTRRTMLPPVAELQAGDMTLDLISHRVERNGEPIDLSPTEFSVLELLMRHEGLVVTRDMLCRNVWGFEWSGTTNAIEVQINRLRRKIDRDGEESMIKTIRGRGYAVRMNRPADTPQATSTNSD